MVDEQQVDRSGAEAVFVGQRVERLSAVPDSAHHAGDPVVDTGVRLITPESLKDPEIRKFLNLDQ